MNHKRRETKARAEADRPGIVSPGSDNRPQIVPGVQTSGVKRSGYRLEASSVTSKNHRPKRRKT
jgi:hypothetical protein